MRCLLVFQGDNNLNKMETCAKTFQKQKFSIILGGRERGKVKSLTEVEILGAEIFLNGRRRFWLSDFSRSKGAYSVKGSARERGGRTGVGVFLISF